MRRLLVMFGFAAVGGATVLTATAFACTVFLGTFSVTPSGGTGAGTSSAVGNGKGMGYCSTSFNATFSSVPQVFGATVATGSCGNLPDNTYTVNYLPGPQPPTTTDCMTPGGVAVGTMTIKGNTGTGSGYTMTLPRNVGPVQICVSDATGLYGNQVQVTVA